MSVRWWWVGGGVIFLWIGLIWWGLFDPQPIEPVSRFDYTSEIGCEDRVTAEFAPTGTILLKLGTGQAAEIGVGDSFRLTLLPIGFVELVGAGETIRPLATFPHIKPTGENEIWIDVVDETAVAIRLNRELYWSGMIPLEGDRLFVACVD